MAAQVAADLAAGAGVEGGERLVEEQQPGFGGQGAGERDPLRLAAGQLARSVPGAVGEADPSPATPRRGPGPRVLATPRARSPKATFSSAVRLANSR